MLFAQTHKKIILIILAIAGMFFVGLNHVNAQAFNYNIKNIAVESGLISEKTTQDTIPEIIGNVIGVILSFVSVLFFLLMIYGGFMWMTARGNEEQSKKAIQVIFGAVVGVAIVLGAYAITRFVFQSFGVGDALAPEGIPSVQQGGGAPSVTKSPCTTAYPTFTCAPKTSCAGDPKEVALVKSTVGKGKHESGKNYITGLCTGGEEIVCCDAPTQKVACMKVVDGGKYACLEVAAGTCSGPTSAVQESMQKCNEAVLKINSATAACLYKDGDVWNCAPAIPLGDFNKTCEKILNATPYTTMNACIQTRDDKNGGDKKWCPTKTGKCELKEIKNCELLPGEEKLEDGKAITFSKESECKEYMELKCSSKYGPSGLSCTASAQDCNNGAPQINLVQSSWGSTQYGVIGSGGYYIQGICPQTAPVCCFTPAATCFYQDVDGKYQCATTSSKENCGNIGFGAQAMSYSECIKKQGESLIYCQYTDPATSKEKCEKKKQKDCIGNIVKQSICELVVSVNCVYTDFTQQGTPTVCKKISEQECKAKTGSKMVQSGSTEYNNYCI